MGALTYNATYYPVLDTHEVTALQIRGVLYDATTPEQALSILNGHLDAANFSGGLTIQAEHVQRGAFVDGWMVAGTANLDYLYRVFTDFDSSATFTRTAAQSNARKVIPGGAITLFVDSGVDADGQLVRLSWTVSWTNDNDDDLSYDTKIVLVEDHLGDAQDIVIAQWRQVNQTIGATPDNHEGYRKNRVWSGHCYVQATRGWHTYALCILQDNRIKQARVWARSLNAVVFYG